MKLKSLLVLALPAVVVVGAAYAQSYFNAPPLIGLISSTGGSPYSSLATTGTAGPSYDNAQAMLLLGLGADGKYHVCGTANPCTGGGGGGGGGATIPSTTNLISGDGAGNGADSGIVPANVALLSGTQTFTGAKTFPGATFTDKTSITSSSATGTISPLGVTNNEASSTLMMTARFKAPNMANGGTQSLLLGQAETTNNGFLLNYTRITLGDSLNRFSIQPYGNAVGLSMFAGTGNVNIGSAVVDSGFKLDVQGSARAATYNTATNCSSAASPAVCAAAAGGSVAVAAAATTVVVNTTAVTANSQILLTSDASLGTKLGVTCNVAPAQQWVSARTAATSFTITVAAAPTTNPQCLSYTITN